MPTNLTNRIKAALGIPKSQPFWMHTQNVTELRARLMEHRNTALYLDDRPQIQRIDQIMEDLRTRKLHSYNRDHCVCGRVKMMTSVKCKWCQRVEKQKQRKPNYH